VEEELLNLSSYLVESKQKGVRQSQWISPILSKAVALWLRSQIESVEQLEILIDAGHRDLFRGQIPQITLKACHGIYQGLHLSQIQVIATQIRTNLGQVLKGQPLQLLEPLDINCQLNLTQTDLNASVAAPLFSDALRDVLLPWLKSHRLLQSIQDVQAHSITLTDLYFILKGKIVSSGEYYPFQLQARLQVKKGQILVLAEPLLQATSLITPTALDPLRLDLGSSVDIQQLTLADQHINLQGHIQVNP
jgi:hypothetical protein